MDGAVLESFLAFADFLLPVLGLSTLDVVALPSFKPLPFAILILAFFTLLSLAIFLFGFFNDLPLVALLLVLPFAVLPFI